MAIVRDIIPSAERKNYNEPRQNFENQNLGRQSDSDNNLVSIQKRRKRFHFLKFVLIILIIIILGAAAFGYKIYVQNGLAVKKSVLGKAPLLKEAIFDFKESARAYDAAGAEAALDKALLIVGDINKETDGYFKHFPPSFFFLPVKKVRDINDYLAVFYATENILKSAKIIISEAKQMPEELGGILSQGDNANMEGGSTLLFKKLDNIEKQLNLISDSFSELGRRSDLISSYVPDFKNQYFVIQKYLDESKEIIAAFKKTLGQNSRRNYLVLFQNSSEIRATGGFLGSYGIVSLENGRLVDFKVDDIYNPDGQVKIKSLNKVIPPRPLWNLTTSWAARDANWFFDFEMSAKKVLSFLEQSGDFPFIDGMAAINTNVIPKILEITGPIRLEEYNISIDASNFLEKVQYAVEEGQDRELFGQPKRILTFLGPALLKKIADSSATSSRAIIGKIYEFSDQKDIMIYSRDAGIQRLIERFGIDGKVLFSDLNEDYLAVVNSNIAGGKTDAFINQNLELTVNIGPDGQIINTLKISRKHNGKNAKYYWQRQTNKDYLRIYAPKGSEFISIEGARRREIYPQADYGSSKYALDNDLAAIEKTYVQDFESGTDVFEESGKTVFGNWLFTDAGQEGVLTIKYKLPYTFPLGKSKEKIGKEIYDNYIYHLLYQKQSGVETSLRVVIKAAAGYKFAETLSDKAYFFKDKTSKLEKVTAKMILDNSNSGKPSISLKSDVKNNWLPAEPEVKVGKAVEVDLKKMKLYTYKDGVLIKEYEVLHKGDPDKWYQTPTGFFKASLKAKNLLSSVVPVFMPYAIQVYEDFFIHGIPYYKNGEKVDTDFSGGCLRISDDDAKEFFEFVEKGTAIVIKEYLSDFKTKNGFVFPVDLNQVWIRQNYNSPLNARGYYESIDKSNLNEKYYQHTGIDLAAKENLNIFAAASGKVFYIQKNDSSDFGFGNAVVLEHFRFNSDAKQNEKFYTLYGHLDKIKDGLTAGDSVSAGDLIGVMGSSGFGCQNYWRKGEDGCANKNEADIHLHFEVKKEGVLENPSADKDCLNRKNIDVYCYGYTPSYPSKYGYFPPIEFLSRE